MKTITLVFCLFTTLPLLAQKHPINFEWPKPRVIGGLFYMFSLGENGTVFYEQDVRGPMSAVMKIAYISADGKTSWVSDKVKNMAIDCDVVWDDAGFTVYNKNSKKKSVEFWHYDYKGKVTASGESKFEYPVLSIFRSGEKRIAILESDKKQLKKLYIQELAPKTFAPAGSPKPVEAPEAKVRSDLQIASRLKGTVENYWAFGGADETRLFFYGKKVLLKEGLVQFEIIITDHSGRKVNGFTRQIELAPGNYVNRTWKSREHLRRLAWYDEFYTGGSSPGETVYVPHYTLDAGTYGECMVDWRQSAVYFYGSSSSKPEDNRIAPDGYFVQKYSLSGEKLWSIEKKIEKEQKGKKLPAEYNSPSNEILYLNPVNKNVLYRKFPALAMVADEKGAVTLNAKPVSAEYSEAGQPRHFDQNKLLGFYHAELMQTDLLSAFLQADAAAALHKHFEANGHPSSFYIIQVNKGYATVLETNPETESYAVWTVPFTSGQ